MAAPLLTREEVTYGSNGNPKEKVSTFSNGKKVVTIFFSNGNPKKETTTFSSGKTIVKSYKSSGRPKSTITREAIYGPDGTFWISPDDPPPPYEEGGDYKIG